MWTMWTRDTDTDMKWTQIMYQKSSQSLTCGEFMYLYVHFPPEYSRKIQIRGTRRHRKENGDCRNAEPSLHGGCSVPSRVQIKTTQTVPPFCGTYPRCRWKITRLNFERIFIDLWNFFIEIIFSTHKVQTVPCVLHLSALFYFVIPLFSSATGKKLILLFKLFVWCPLGIRKKVSQCCVVDGQLSEFYNQIIG